MSDILGLSVSDLSRRVRAGEVSAVSVAEACFSRLEATAHLNAFLHVDRAAALTAAERMDARRARGERLGKLAGVPVGIKDALCMRDVPTTAGSRILTRSGGKDSADAIGWRPPYDATVIERLRSEDALLVGKLNMDEFAMGSSNENSAFGPVLNPHDETRVPGGSSGGSAAAVASQQVPAALGSDTGGSIRQPAALCGVVGLKPSYGRVSRYGLIAFASSLDQVGPLASDVRGAARVLEVIAGHDTKDSTSVPVPVGSYEGACERGVSGLRIGIPREYFAEGLDDDVRQAVEQCVDELVRLGARVTPVGMPHTKYGVSTYYIISAAEASSNLARFDGVRFGMRVEGRGANLEQLYSDTRGQGFGTEVKRRIMLGTYVLSAGYYDAYYGKAQRVRTLIQRDFEAAFAHVDVLATPISPTPAFRLGERVGDPLQMYLQDVYTLPASLAGVCGISVPVRPTLARADRPALPVGIQLLAPAFAEEQLLAVAAAAEACSRAATAR